MTKAIKEATRAKLAGDEHAQAYAQKMVDCFTDQLNESNPILTEISNAMTLEGFCRDKMEHAQVQADSQGVDMWRSKMSKASGRKADANQKLMECSARYQKIMRSIREDQGSLCSD